MWGMGTAETVQQPAGDPDGRSVEPVNGLRMAAGPSPARNEPHYIRAPDFLVFAEVRGSADHGPAARHD